MGARVRVRTQPKYARTDYMLSPLAAPLLTVLALGTALVLAGRGRARMRTDTAAERAEGGARGRAVARHAHRLRVALPLRPRVEFRCVVHPFHPILLARFTRTCTPSPYPGDYD